MSGGVVPSFDVSFVCVSLERRLGGLRPAEIHSICYLARLLAFYDGWPDDAWGYEFASTKAGAPFASRLDEAIGLLIATGALANEAELLHLSERGEDILGRTFELPSLARRQRWLEPACSVTLTMPLPAVTDALTQEPQLRTAVALAQTRPLLDETGLAILRPQVDVLRSALSENPVNATDLLVPAVVWLTYLSGTREKSEVVGAP